MREPLPQVVLDQIDSLVGRYPTRRAALLPSLWLVQDARGWISREDVAEVSDRLGLAAADAEGVLSFYFLFHRRPRGRVVIDVCDNVICQANGAEQNRDPNPAAHNEDEARDEQMSIERRPADHRTDHARDDHEGEHKPTGRHLAFFSVSSISWNSPPGTGVLWMISCTMRSALSSRRRAAGLTMMR